ncbi:MAG: SGNH/GDSL hydrolase family protein [bacterium]|nr:GDSL-type esterase/lipase family protein [Parabacteroides sp.]MDD6078815.1 SGNH/GDSL hydrolase family protein [bacterium]
MCRCFMVYIILCFCFVACDEVDNRAQVQEVSHFIPENATFILPSDPHIEYVGRISFANPDAPRFTYPGVSISALFEGTSLNMIAKPMSGFFMVRIDDNDPFKVAFANEQDSVITLASQLPDGIHEVFIMNCIESFLPVSEFRGFLLDQDCHLQAKERQYSLRLEFVGNSMTCGYGIESNNPSDTFSKETENHYYAYPALVSKGLNAQYVVVARSGIGVYRNYGGPVEGSVDCLPNLYDYTLYGDTTEVWDFSRYIPDIVCVNLGTNDCVLEGYSIHLLKDAFVKFSQKLRSIYPDAKIIWMTGCMLHGKPLEDLQSVLDEVVQESKTAGDKCMYRFDFTPQTGDLGYAAGWHPSRQQHERMADELISFMRTIVNG